MTSKTDGAKYTHTTTPAFIEITKNNAAVLPLTKRYFVSFKNNAFVSLSVVQYVCEEDGTIPYVYYCTPYSSSTTGGTFVPQEQY